MLDDLKAFETLKLSRDGAVLRIEIARADVKNAVNRQMHGELATVFQLADADPHSRIVVLTGAGDAFCAGGDIEYMKYMRDTPGAFAESTVEARRIVFGMLDMAKPMVARINGDAIGLGATLALFSDITVAVDTARIADPHVRVGLVAGDGGAVIWPALVGYARAKAALLTGKAVAAADAVAMGLINEAVPADELDARVAAWVRDLDIGATMAVRYTKMAVNAGLRQLASTMLDASLACEIVTALSPDHAEAVDAFEQRRRPDFDKSLPKP